MSILSSPMGIFSTVIANAQEPLIVDESLLVPTFDVRFDEKNPNCWGVNKDCKTRSPGGVNVVNKPVIIKENGMAHVSYEVAFSNLDPSVRSKTWQGNIVQIPKEAKNIRFTLIGASKVSEEQNVHRPIGYQGWRPVWHPASVNIRLPIRNENPFPEFATSSRFYSLETGAYLANSLYVLTGSSAVDGFRGNDFPGYDAYMLYTNFGEQNMKVTEKPITSAETGKYNSKDDQNKYKPSPIKGNLVVQKGTGKYYSLKKNGYTASKFLIDSPDLALIAKQEAEKAANKAKEQSESIVKVPVVTPELDAENTIL